MKTHAVALLQEIELARKVTAVACQSHSHQDCLEQDCQDTTALSTARDALRGEILAHLQTIGLNGNRPRYAPRQKIRSGTSIASIGKPQETGYSGHWVTN